MIASAELQFNSTNPFWRFMNRLENGAGFVLLMILALIPVLDAVLREFFQSGVPYGQNILGAIIIPMTFIGIALASRHDRHLNVNFGLKERQGLVGIIARIVNAAASGLVVGLFFLNSVQFLVGGFTMNEIIVVIPLIVFMLAYPLGFLIVIIRTYPRKDELGVRFSYLAGLVLSVILGMSAVVPVLDTVFHIPSASLGMEFVDASWWSSLMGIIKLPAVLFLLLAAITGTPLFMVLGGMAVFFFGSEGQSAFFAFSDGYAQVLKNATTPAIALFTFVGYLLSESQACQRLITLFKNMLGRLPGGIIIVAVMVSAFFTCFTGANGITILALGAVLFAILKDSGKNSDSLSVGLITSSGAIGLLFPPSLAIIVYGAIEMTSVSTGGGTPANILQLFLAGILPGFLMVLGTLGLGIILSWREGRSSAVKAKREKPAPVPFWTILRNLRESALELLLPVIILMVYFTGLADIVETAAIAVVYTLIVEVFVKREINLKKLVQIGVYTLTIYGGILAILTFAKGLSSYFVFSQFDIALVDWVTAHIQSPLVFLLLVNLLLFVVGCLMDIFSAITIFVPLLTAVATAFGIDQAHLAIIFLANLSVGFITPPVGMDLFLAAYRFERPMTKLYRDVLPFMLVQIAVVILITYVPWFSMSLQFLAQ